MFLCIHDFDQTWTSLAWTTTDQAKGLQIFQDLYVIKKKEANQEIIPV